MHRRALDASPVAIRTLSATLLVIVLLAGACTDNADWQAESIGAAGGQESTDPAGIAPLGDATRAADFAVRGSIEQVSVTGAEPGTTLALHDTDGTASATVESDDQGSAIFRQVDPGMYRVATVPAAAATADGDGDGGGSDGSEADAEQEVAEAVTVIAVEDSTPEQNFYDEQTLEKGFQYVTTRDGTTLSANVTLPGPIEDGPYPTVVEYSGYSPSKPATNLIADRWDDLKDSLPDGLTIDQVCALASFACEAADQPASLIASALGYAVVSVNMRGTGCSGGAYDFFEPLQVLDGYDVIETVAAQPWVKNHKVGMVGLSYPGISQLFVAASQPPSLEAITPLSVYDDTARGVLAPGGVFNEGFALTWADEVLTNAEPYGQGWEQAVVDSGDQVCAQNQLLRGQNVDAVSKAKQYPYYDPEVADPLNPSLFAEDITVPVFLTGSFQDEQTGGRFPLLFDEFTNAPVTKFSAWNGAHADGFQPANLVEWKTFLDFYVAGELTPRSLPAELFLPVIMGEVFGNEAELPPQRMFEDEPTFEAKKAAYEAESPIRVRLESGAGDPEQPGMPNATVDVRVPSWPLPDTTATPWYFQPDGTMSLDPPTNTGESASSFEVTPELAKLRTWEGDDSGDLFKADVTYDWQHEPAGAATVYVSEPLDEDQVMIGSASADLWVRSATGEADLGVTLSEVRPDGKEVYIQSGTLRATQRKVAKGSTELLPLHTNLREDAAPLPADEFTEARVEIFPFGQIVRAGSRLRISVHTPGGDKARWSYILAPQPAGATIEIGHSADMPSRVVLPVVAGITGYPDALPPCPGLRAQPCRQFEDYDNTALD